jgi:DNA-binding CsgD family transcriptional regulator
LQEGAFVLSVPRPEGWLRRVLTPCEWRAVEMRIAGCSHHEAARQCGVSVRTIANQIASSYRKLGVSARLELLNRILADDQVQRSRLGFVLSFESHRGADRTRGEGISCLSH